MSRTLLLLRHAKAAWDTDAPSDFERPLAKRGKKDAPRIGRFLRMEGLVPDLVFSSSARRARKTASKVARELELSKKEIVLEDRLYEASLGTLLEFLATVPADAETVLLVGHIPDLENLLRHLARELPKSPEGKLLPTCAVARLVMPDDWRVLGRGVAELVSITRPKDLPEDA